MRLHTCVWQPTSHRAIRNLTINCLWPIASSVEKRKQKRRVQSSREFMNRVAGRPSPNRVPLRSISLEAQTTFYENLQVSKRVLLVSPRQNDLLGLGCCSSRIIVVISRFCATTSGGTTKWAGTAVTQIL